VDELALALITGLVVSISIIALVVALLLVAAVGVFVVALAAGSAGAKLVLGGSAGAPLRVASGESRWERAEFCALKSYYSSCCGEDTWREVKRASRLVSRVGQSVARLASDNINCAQSVCEFFLLFLIKHHDSLISFFGCCTSSVLFCFIGCLELEYTGKAQPAFLSL